MIKKIMIIGGLFGLTGCAGYQEYYGHNEPTTIIPTQPVSQTIVQPAAVLAPAPMIIVPTRNYWFRHRHHHHHCR